MGEKLVQLVVEDPTYISSSEGCPNRTTRIPYQNTAAQTLPFLHLEVYRCRIAPPAAIP